MIQKQQHQVDETRQSPSRVELEGLTGASGVLSTINHTYS